MKVTFEKDGKIKHLEFSGTLTEFFEVMQINPESVIVARGDEVLEDDQRITNEDELLIISVISGG